MGCTIPQSKFLELNIRAGDIAFAKILVNITFSHAVTQRIHQWSYRGCKAELVIELPIARKNHNSC